jgi:hypothetical protein
MAIWYKSYADLKDHPKLFMFSTLLKVGEVEALGYLHLFFSAVCAYAEDGGINKLPPAVIEKLCKWGGEAGHFFKSLKEVGFIKEIEGDLVVNKWWEINGSHIQESERKRKYREAKRVQGLSEDSPGTDQGRSSPTDRQTDRQTDSSSRRASIDDALERFTQLRKSQPAYAQASYDPGAKGRAAATNLICGPKPPTQEEYDDAAGNFFASDAAFTFNHDAASFFGKFHAWLGGPLNRGGAGKRSGDAQDGHQRGESGGVRAGGKNGSGGRRPLVDRSGKSVGPPLD